MLFYSFEFLYLFFPVSIIGYFTLGRVKAKWALIWLVLCSLSFYSWWNPSYLVLLMGSVLFNYYIGLVIRQSRSKVILATGVAANLCLIAYYKYAGFLVDTVSDVTGVTYQVGNIVLPLAISFFTFQQIAWLVDNYSKKIDSKDKGFWEYSLFVTFFPQLIAGPIVHHSEMMPQFHKDENRRVIWGNIAAGISIFSIGLAKKVLIADSLSPYANTVFSAANTGMVGFVDAWVGVLAYTMQLYFDFSGYADMAIGLGMMFNINLPLNFHSPYKAESIIDFWRRWHMTLSRFLRDYVYIALGGNRKGNARRYTNLMLTMLLGGLWHGAGWTFVMWGALHGLYLVINHLWSSFLQFRMSPVLSRMLTFIAVVIAWAFFRAENFQSAMNIIYSMMDLSSIVSEQVDYIVDIEKSVFLLCLALIITNFLPNTQEIMGEKCRGIKIYALSRDKSGGYALTWHSSMAWLMYIAIINVFSVYFLLDQNRIQEFIYFQF